MEESAPQVKPKRGRKRKVKEVTNAQDTLGQPGELSIDRIKKETLVPDLSPADSNGSSLATPPPKQKRGRKKKVKVEAPEAPSESNLLSLPQTGYNSHSPSTSSDSGTHSLSPPTFHLATQDMQMGQDPYTTSSKLPMSHMNHEANGYPMNHEANGYHPMNHQANGYHPINHQANGYHPINHQANGYHPINPQANGYHPMTHQHSGHHPMNHHANGYPLKHQSNGKFVNNQHNGYFMNPQTNEYATNQINRYPIIHQGNGYPQTDNGKSSQITPGHLIKPERLSRMKEFLQDKGNTFPPPSQFDFEDVSILPEEELDLENIQPFLGHLAPQDGAPLEEDHFLLHHYQEDLKYDHFRTYLERTLGQTNKYCERIQFCIQKLEIIRDNFSHPSAGLNLNLIQRMISDGSRILKKIEDKNRAIKGGINNEGFNDSAITTIFDGKLLNVDQQFYHMLNDSYETMDSVRQYDLTRVLFTASFHQLYRINCQSLSHIRDLKLLSKQFTDFNIQFSGILQQAKQTRSLVAAKRHKPNHNLPSLSPICK